MGGEINTMETNSDFASNRRSFFKKLIAVSSVSTFAILGTKAFSGNTSYKYDDIGRLIQVTNANNTVTTYSYDAAGNRTQETTAASSSSSSASATVIQVTSTSNLRTLANNAGYNGSTSANYQFVVPAGTTIYGSSIDGRGISTGTWPAGVTLSLVVSGNVYGRGGTGGNGAGYYGSATAGTIGGDAIYCQAPIAITINSGGSVKGGGNGGAGGSSMVTYSTPYSTIYFGAGGGGGGFPSGIGGSGGAGANGGGNGSDGGNGTTSGGGAGGAGASSPGTTSPGSPGGGAGSSGYAIRKNGNSVPVTNNGTVAGAVS